MSPHPALCRTLPSHFSLPTSCLYHSRWLYSLPADCRPAARRATLAVRARNVAIGLTSPSRPVTWGAVRKTTSGVLNTVSPSHGEAPAESPNAGPGCERLPAFLRSCWDRCSARGRDAAQQKLRTPDTASSRKVNARGLPSGGSTGFAPTRLRSACLSSRPVLISDETKAQVVVPAPGRVLDATGATHVPGVDVPAPATNGPRLDCSATNRVHYP